MKAPFVLIILFFVVGVSAWSYHNKSREEKDDIDRLTLALEGVKDIVPAGRAISFAGNVDITISSQSRYILAPGIILAEHRDTALAIYSLQDSILSAGNILWHHTDDRYKYYITTGNAE